MSSETEASTERTTLLGPPGNDPVPIPSFGAITQCDDRPEDNTETPRQDTHGTPTARDGTSGLTSSTGGTGDAHVKFGAVALFCLLAQHTSNVFGASTANYAAYIFLAETFPDTLAPASSMGMIGALAPTFLAGWMGKMIDRTDRLKFARNIVVSQKLVQNVIYACFTVYLGSFKDAARLAIHGKGSKLDILATWAMFIVILLFTVVIKTTDIGISVATEKDWVLTISKGDSSALTRLNSYMRMIGTVSKLFPPLVTAIFVVAFGHRGAATALIVTSTAALFLEYWWLQVVFDRFPALNDNLMKRQAAAAKEGHARSTSAQQVGAKQQGLLKRISSSVIGEVRVWRTFGSLPIFLSSLAVTVIFISTLTLDGTGVAYFKLVHQWDEVVLAKIRMGALVTSLMGSCVVTVIEPRIGTAPTALVSDITALICLAISLVGFFAEGGTHRASTASGYIMIIPIVISRLAFTAFELAQLKELQIALADRLDRNQLSALQSALINVFVLLRYLMLFVVSDPGRFKWTAAVSVGSSVVSVCVYALHMFRLRKPRKGQDELQDNDGEVEPLLPSDEGQPEETRRNE